MNGLNDAIWVCQIFDVLASSDLRSREQTRQSQHSCC